MAEKKRKVGKIIGNIIFYAVMIFLIFVCVTMVKAKKSGEQPSVFGHKFYIVLTGSMSPTIYPGDLVIVKNMPPEDIQAGDIITFASSQSDNITTHRVKEVINDNGSIKFVTQGDANNVQDPNPVDGSLLIGKVTKYIPRLGSKMQYMQDHLTQIIIVIIAIGVIAGIWIKVFDSHKKEEKKSIKQ